jgi:hypothetical protein
MSVKLAIQGFACVIPEELLRDPRVGRPELAVYIVYASEQGAIGEEWEAPLEELASAAGLDVEQFARALRSLQELGWMAGKRTLEVAVE